MDDKKPRIEQIIHKYKITKIIGVIISVLGPITGLILGILGITPLNDICFFTITAIGLIIYLVDFNYWYKIDEIYYADYFIPELQKYHKNVKMITDVKSQDPTIQGMYYDFVNLGLLVDYVYDGIRRYVSYQDSDKIVEYLTKDCITGKNNDFSGTLVKCIILNSTSNALSENELREKIKFLRNKFGSFKYKIDGNVICILFGNPNKFLGRVVEKETNFVGKAKDSVNIYNIMIQDFSELY